MLELDMGILFAGSRTFRVFPQLLLTLTPATIRGNDCYFASYTIKYESEFKTLGAHCIDQLMYCCSARHPDEVQDRV